MIPQTIPSEPSLKHAILLTITYADVFDYPLTAPEVHRYLTGRRASPEQVNQALSQMSTIVQTGDYFSLNSRESVVTLRKDRERKSTRLWAQATRYGRQIANLPHVRMVAITGSLAMNNINNQADIDYLIVTAPGHLWLTRAMILALRRIARFEGINLCPNYLITTRALHIPDQNLYVAHELTQMIPLSGLDIYHEIRRQNKWVDQYLPNAAGIPAILGAPGISIDESPFRPLLERVLHNSLIAKLEHWEMKRKIEMLTREQWDSPESCFSTDFCKGHMNRHGFLTNEAFNQRLDNFPLESLL